MEELLKEESEVTKYNIISNQKDFNKYVGRPQIVSAR
jgi:hypothetical protein